MSSDLCISSCAAAGSYCNEGSAWADRHDSVHDILHESSPPLHMPKCRDKGWLHAITSAVAAWAESWRQRFAMRDAGGQKMLEERVRGAGGWQGDKHHGNKRHDGQKTRSQLSSRDCWPSAVLESGCCPRKTGRKEGKQLKEKGQLGQQQGAEIGSAWAAHTWQQAEARRARQGKAWQGMATPTFPLQGPTMTQLVAKPR